MAIIVVGITLHLQSLKISGGDNQAMINYFEMEKEQLIQDRELLVQEVKTINQNIVSSDEEIKKLSKELSEYKVILSHTKAEIVSELKNIDIPYIVVDNPIYLSDTGCTSNKIVKEFFIQVPSKVNYSDQWTSFNGTLGKDKFTLDSLSMINKFDITIGEKKVGKKLLVFNKYEPVVEMKSYNPYSSVPYMNNLTVEKKRNNFGGKTIGYAVAFGLGFATSKLVSQ